MSEPREPVESAPRPDALYFFPEEDLTAIELRAILAGDDQSRRVWAISYLLRYAQWEDIWTYVDRDQVVQLLPDLDLPDTLRSAWGRVLKKEGVLG